MIYGPPRLSVWKLNPLTGERVVQTYENSPPPLDGFLQIALEPNYIIWFDPKCWDRKLLHTALGQEWCGIIFIAKRSKSGDWLEFELDQ